MRVFDVRRLGDSVVLYFDTDERRINAYTLASSLVAIADAAKAANADLNHGYDIEIVVEALGSGSFKARIAAVYKKANNLFSKQALLNCVLAAVVTHVVEKSIWPDKRQQVTITTDEVIIEHGDERIVVPRNVYNATRQIEALPRFKNAVARLAEKVVQDESVRGISFIPDMDSTPEFILKRDELLFLSQEATEEVPERVIEDQCELQIIKAILEPGRRKWEFVWRGVRITAPILDEQFYARFASHEITIAPGDTLKVRLAMKQRKEPNIEIYTTSEYEVVEVLEHTKRLSAAAR